MTPVVPLIEITLNSFLKGFNQNSAQLHALRRQAKRSDGFFMYRDDANLNDTFPLVGQKYNGQWRLGQIRLDAGGEGESDYVVEIYRRSLNKQDAIGSAQITRPMDDHALAEILRDLNKGVSLFTHPSEWQIYASATFSTLGFDIQ